MSRRKTAGKTIKSIEFENSQLLALNAICSAERSTMSRVVRIAVDAYIVSYLREHNITFGPQALEEIQLSKPLLPKFSSADGRNTGDHTRGELGDRRIHIGQFNKTAEPSIHLGVVNKKVEPEDEKS